MINKIFFTIIIFQVFISCNSNEDFIFKPILNSENIKIGDSIFSNGQIKKLVFNDSFYFIDSIVFERYRNKNIKSFRTFKNGKKIFENIEYYSNGKINKYFFIDEDNNDIFYERDYNTLGKLENTKGEIFFQGYIDDIINENTLEVKKGNILKLQIFYPNVPDCNVKLYIKYDDGRVYNVFAKSKYLDFLQHTSWDNNEIGIYKLNVWMDIIEKDSSLIRQYNNTLIYKVK